MKWCYYMRVKDGEVVETLDYRPSAALDPVGWRQWDGAPGVANGGVWVAVEYEADE